MQNKAEIISKEKQIQGLNHCPHFTLSSRHIYSAWIFKEAFWQTQSDHHFSILDKQFTIRKHQLHNNNKTFHKRSDQRRLTLLPFQTWYNLLATWVSIISDRKKKKKLSKNKVQTKIQSFSNQILKHSKPNKRFSRERERKRGRRSNSCTKSCLSLSPSSLPLNVLDQIQLS